MKENRISEDKIAKSYWESVDFAKDAYKLMKEISQKLSEPGTLRSLDYFFIPIAF
ncbi:hypothetical protein OAC70_03800 [Flavobacteriaceae bacterium]|jgi:hypothetical protein|nr:hypothetical protein [Flavobacteriaceae bacterium]MDB4186166.1 hypothetical protein [Flavobacteriaceae bacterium]MDB9886532.1 hypothetical protein [Flavobacteriaceae bacterium]